MDSTLAALATLSLEVTLVDLYKKMISGQGMSAILRRDAAPSGTAFITSSSAKYSVPYLLLHISDILRPQNFFRPVTAPQQPTSPGFRRVFMSTPLKSAAIGVFDSGVGGLSVLREIRATLPAEDLLYVADSGHAPYGDRPDTFIRQRAETITAFFVSKGVKAVVIACNTATAVAVQTLRSKHSIPIVAMEPALKPAMEITHSKVIGILATSRTLASESFSRLAEKHGNGARVLLQPCQGFVEQVEKAELNGLVTEALIQRHISPLIEQGADTLVLGCTHYPFLKETIRSVAGPGVSIIDPSAAVARQLRHRLTTNDLLSDRGTPGSERFLTSGAPHKVQAVCSRLWGQPVQISSFITKKPLKAIGRDDPCPKSSGNNLTRRT